MYSYIYDGFTTQKKYKKQLLKIEGELADLGIGGKAYKLSVLRNLKDVVDEILSGEEKNIVVIGNDQTMSRVANLVVGKNVALGIIPIGEPNILAESIGIKPADEACRIVSARNIAKLDVGKINGQYFLLAVESPDEGIIFDFKDYNINPLAGNEAVGVYNINIDGGDFKSDPCDGVMEAVFKPAGSSWWERWLKKQESGPDSGISVFPVKKLTLRHKKKPIPISIDRQTVLKTPVEVEILPKKIKMIVGKQRVFN